MLFNAQSSHWQGLGLVSVAFGWSRCLLFISAVQIAWAKRYSMHFIMYLRDVFVTLSVSWDFTFEVVYERKSYIFSLLIFPPAQVQIFWFTRLLQGRKWPRKQNKHKKSAIWKGVRDEEREREQKKAEQLWKQGSQLRGMKGTGCRRLFVKNDLWMLPHSPKCLFFISLSHFTVGSRARNLGEISLSRFIYSLPDRPKIA